MTSGQFETATGRSVPAVTSDQMREIDRVAVEEAGLGLLVMMENAGRNLAAHAIELHSEGQSWFSLAVTAMAAVAAAVRDISETTGSTCVSWWVELTT